MELLLSGWAGAVPLTLMLLVFGLAVSNGLTLIRLWRIFIVFSGLATVIAALTLVFLPSQILLDGWLSMSRTSLAVGLLVQLLGTIIASFSARYLEGEPNQVRYIAYLALLLASVHGLLLADNWLVLIAAWALIGAALQPLLCFYAERPFALLAAHKKRLADRLADLLLIAAALLAWQASGTLSISELKLYLQQHSAEFGLQLSALLLVLAVVLRSALLPVHGWLVQVMEAPTPVSALLHAGVVNLGGYVLINFAPLLQQAPVARWVLFGLGLLSAVLAGLVMLTRISIKVRLAWSTLAQMGFMLMQCALGLYTLALLHLLGHSVYKAYAFLSASEAVRNTGLGALVGKVKLRTLSLWCAPVLAALTIGATQFLVGLQSWPIWWTLVLAFAWAPLLWVPVAASSAMRILARGTALILLLSFVAQLLHLLPLAPADAADDLAGALALFAFGLLYLLTVVLQLLPRSLNWARRWSYAGFYLDEQFTRLTLKFWPADWSGTSTRTKEV